MMENMVCEIARTMQSDRRAQSANAALLAEAERIHDPAAPSSRMRTRRAAIAKALTALATRIAPPAPEGGARPGMVADLTT
jgi:hypothetical protein